MDSRLCSRVIFVGLVESEILVARLMQGMNAGKVLAITITFISAGASIGYLVAGDYRRAIYWAGAVIVNAAVVF